jgi:hypothetical protein
MTAALPDLLSEPDAREAVEDFVRTVAAKCERADLLRPKGLEWAEKAADERWKANVSNGKVAKNAV